jgi:hypothetical protein
MLNGIDAMNGTTGGGELTIKSEAGDAQLRRMLIPDDTRFLTGPGRGSLITAQKASFRMALTKS